jgi:sulfatase modifying factor 1
VRRDGQSLEAAVADVVWVVEHFRRPDRSFLVPAVDRVGQLTAESLLDISHEALIRQWGKLSQTWLDDEEQSRRRYRRLVEAAEGEETAGLMQDPELSFLESWWRGFAPRPAWGEGLRPGSFARAAEFLKRSRELLDANKRRHRNRLLLWGTLGLLLAGLLLWERSRSAWQAEGKNFAARFLASPAAFQEDLLKYREVALPELRKGFQRQGTDAVQQRERLHAAYGLARYVPTDDLLTFLGTEAARLDALEFDLLSRSLAALLQSLGRDTGEYVEQQLQLAVNDGDRQLELRWLMLGVALGETTRLDSYCAAKDDPSDATALMVDLAKIPIDVSWLSEVLRDNSRVRPATRYVLCLVLGGLQGSGVAARATLEELYRTAGDCGTHSAARWALLQQGVPSKSLDEMIAGRDGGDAESGKRDWYVTGQAGTAAGLTMLRIPTVPEFRLGAVAGEGEDKDPGDEDSQQWTAADRKSVGEFWMSDREVSREQFQAVCPEWQRETSEIAATDRRHPVRQVNWYDALLFCNRLSVQHRLPQYYEFDEGQYDWAAGELKDGAKFPSIANPAGGGYRLPTEREWEYACRALSAEDYSFGVSADSLDLFARWNGKSEPLACGSLRPNRWGLSDMHGNVWEWCWDRYDTTNEEVAETSRVCRGGSFLYNYPGSLRCASRSINSPDIRDNLLGFRISRTK